MILSKLELRPLFSFPRFIAGGLGDLNLGEVGETEDNGLDLVAARDGGSGGGGGGVLGANFLRELRRSKVVVVGTRLQVGWRTARSLEAEEIIFVPRGHIIVWLFEFVMVE